MQITQFRIVFFSSVIVSMFSLLAPVNSQTPEETSIQDSEELSSIFEDDPCAPPCWFGLTPGTSTAQDVVDTVPTIPTVTCFGPAPNNLDRIIDEQTGDVIDERFQFCWQRPGGLGGRVPLNSFIVIKSRFLYRIELAMNDVISLNEVIASFGLPDYVYLTPGDRFSPIELIYVEPLARVRLIYDNYNLEPCDTTNIGDNYWVGGMTYHSPEFAVEPVFFTSDRLSPKNGYETGESQPALFAHTTFIQDYDVLPETLESWLSIDEEIACDDLWQDLPPATGVPILSLTPMPTATAISSSEIEPVVEATEESEP